MSNKKMHPLTKIIMRAIAKNKSKIKVFCDVFGRREYVILFLYLLHHPDYPYNIAKTFKEVIKKKRRKVSFPLSLTDPSKVSTILKEMEKATVVRYYKEKNNGKERIYYDVSPAVLTQDLEMEIKKGNVTTDEYTHPEVIGICISIIQAISPDKIRCIKKIISLKKSDYLTILLYFRNLVAEMEALYFDQPWPYSEEAFLIKTPLKEIKKKIKVNEDDLSSLLTDYTRFLDSIIMASMYEERGLQDMTCYVS